MNHQHSTAVATNNYNTLSTFQQNKLAWENAIDAYIGEDPLELWFNFICWYEHNVALDTENCFEAILGKCLSMYEYKENFKQDTRMVQLWMKYIDLKPNALNLYQLLYQRNVGTKCTIFYVGWARYFESAGAFKQAESVFNLGFQVKAEPYEELKEAHAKFRMNVAQRVMYDGNSEVVSSKKRAASDFDEANIEQQCMPQHQAEYDTNRINANLPTHIPQPEDAASDNVAQHNLSHNHSQMQPSAKRHRTEANAYNNNEATCPPNEPDQCDLNNSANVISSSLYSVYDDTQSTNYVEDVAVQKDESLRINLPPNFVSYASNHTDNWSVALCLEEPYEPNKFCNYPKLEVYPGDGTEFSPEEIRARKWAGHLAAIQEQKRQAEFQQQEAIRLNREEEERLRLESEHQRLMREEQERLRAAAEYERHRVAEQERIRIAEYQRRAADLERKRVEQEHERIRLEQIQLQQQQQFQHQQQQYYQLNGYSHHSTAPTNTTTSVIRTVNDDGIDDEQIEASTIRFSTGNGLSKPKTITIKFRKEKPAIAAPQQVPSTHPTQQQMQYHQLQSTNMANSYPATDDVHHPKVKKEKKSKGSKKLLNGIKHNHHQPKVEREMLEVRTHQELPPPTQPSSDDSNFSYAGSSYATPATPSSSHRTARFARLTGEEDDSCSNSDYPYSADNSNGFTPRTSSKPFQSFGSGHTSTPIRTPAGTTNGNYLNDAFAKSTPHNFKILKKRESNLSYQNDDSMCSLSSTLNGADQNSFFASENDTELQQRRLDKALATIQTHLDKPTLDPFNSELCKAFLTKIGFPSREHSDLYKLVSQPINKLSNARMAMLANVPFQIEKEVGRGSYGSVYRATNVTTGATVALKYQKPANNWELYICTEVHRRIKNPDVIPGFMDISAGIVAPNASIIVSEFSPYGSLLDINNQIRQNTTKVMHESMVMHFSSQILNIVDHLHRNKIIHADIKPDNFLLMKIPDPNTEVPSIRLIDFGCAIDMNCFDEKTQFKKRIDTDGFTCIEMQEGRPWSYQTDIFCIAGTIHVMLFGEYMHPVKKFGQWEIKNKLPRYLKKHIWSDLFTKFLNIKDVDHLPDLLDIKAKIDDELYGMESELQKHIRTLSNILHKR